MRRQKTTYTHKLQNHSTQQLFLLPIILTVMGLFFIFEASSVTAYRQLGDSFYFLRQQLMWSAIGICAMSVVSFINYRRWYYFAFPALLVSMFFLVIVLIPGIGTNVYGARRWIDFGFFSFQPTELAKLASILYLSAWFLYKDRKRFKSFLLLLGVVVGLIMLQPDLGTTLIISLTFLSIYFISGEKLAPLLAILPVGLVGVIALIITSPYRFARLTAFLHPTADPTGIGYHINQILISLSSGGLLGKGFSHSRQKYQFLPEAHTDSIFAIIGEELGFMGSVVFIGVYAYVLYQIYLVAKRSQDRFGYILVSSIFVVMSLQAIINLSGMLALLPLTGVPLPFISYGGSSLLIFYTLMGIVISVDRHR